MTIDAIRNSKAVCFYTKIHRFQYCANNFCTYQIGRDNKHWIYIF